RGGRRAYGVMNADPALWVELRERLTPLFGADIAIERLSLLAGGASKEAWALDLRTPQGKRELLVRRAGGGVIHKETLSLEDEHRLLEVAFAAGVRVPKPYGYLGEIAGRPAFASERVSGTSRSTRRASAMCSIGSSGTAATRPKTSPGRSCGPGASASITCAWVASARSSRISSVTTRSPVGTSRSPRSTTGRSWAI